MQNKVNQNYNILRTDLAAYIILLICCDIFLSDGAPIADMITSGRFSLVSQGTLIIRALEVGDSGMYSCAARNTASERPVIQRSRLTVIGMTAL